MASPATYILGATPRFVLPDSTTAHRAAEFLQGCKKGVALSTTASAVCSTLLNITPVVQTSHTVGRLPLASVVWPLDIPA